MSTAKSSKIQPGFPKCYKQSSKPHNFCPGCGHPVVLNAIGRAVDELRIQKKTVFLIDIGCSLLAWDFFDIDTSQTHHGRTIPVATGFKRANPDAVVIAYLGDGGAYAIGMQHLVHAALRNEKVTTIIINNLNYGMTGGQMAPTTLPKQPPTTTAPFGRDEKVFGKMIKGPELVESLAPAGAYVARRATDNPILLKQSIKKALEHQIKGTGFSFVESLSYCPTNWKTDAKETLEWLEKFKKQYPIYEKVT
ncbi:MAG: thiamine pyrophosphate-dependent enzyme [Patescibacteria group bacterium]|nr:thiamine pyrophosphate-dependent enzyme [Patescibacteria group bacterium]